jgi:NAD-dependent dihydropyrimidine dehydrogenase PreA subunit
MASNHFGNGIARGMAVTLKNLLRRPVTVQYPEQKLTLSQRERGTVLSWSQEKCTGCYTCANNCPHGCITIETAAEGKKWASQAPCSQRCRPGWTPPATSAPSARASRRGGGGGARAHPLPFGVRLHLRPPLRKRLHPRRY